jgi:uncharacterized protein (DUF1501 family)
MTGTTPTTMATDDQFSRRAALQLIAAGVSIAAISEPLRASVANAASPNGASPNAVAPAGVALVVYLGGGNDHLNTLVPIGDGRYYDNRRGLALRPNSVLDIGGGWGLNDRLAYTKKLWDLGHVAVYQGVGYPDSSLSHFESIATWMSGRFDGDRSTGWIGRYLDSLAAELPTAGVSIGYGVPLLMTGTTSQAIALSDDFGGAIDATATDPANVRLIDTLRRFGDGMYASKHEQAIARNALTSIDTAGVLTREFAGLPGGGVARRMGAAARVLSAGLGVKVAYVQQDGYDTHANQLRTHSGLLSELDAGVESFFSNLSPAVRPNAVVVIFSEFGRRPIANGSAGTDHGTAGDVWVLGDSVVGGRRGQPTSFTDLDQDGNFIVTSNFGPVLTEALTPILGSSIGSALNTSARAMPNRIRR